MQRISQSLTSAFIIVSFIIGLGVGYYISPAYQESMYAKSEEMGLGTADRYVDLRYVDQMIAHHMGAVLLAGQIIDKTQRTDIRYLAATIQTEEPKLIAELYEWKKAWYNNTRKVTDPIVPNIGGADEKTDLRFLNALIAHHEEGIRMTQEIRTKSSRKEVLDNADAVENFLNGSLSQLKQWREDWYGIR